MCQVCHSLMCPLLRLFISLKEHGFHLSGYPEKPLIQAASIINLLLALKLGQWKKYIPSRKSPRISRLVRGRYVTGLKAENCLPFLLVNVGTGSRKLIYRHSLMSAKSAILISKTIGVSPTIFIEPSAFFSYLFGFCQFIFFKIINQVQFLSGTL